jgi:phosphate transport system protein
VLCIGILACRGTQSDPAATYVDRASAGVDKEMTMSIAVGEHTTKAFDADLQNLTRMIAEMGGYTEKQLIESIEALAKRDRERALRVVKADTTVDALQREIEERAVATIATRQPMAVDLRDIVGVLRIANDLERIGDLAKNISKRVMALNGGDMPRKAVRGVSHMGALALDQLRDVLDSFARRDSALALAVWSRDEEIDAMYTSLFRELLTYMMEDPGTIAFGIHLLMCAKNIERVGDHATNIAEAVYYMVEGHPFPDERPKADATSGIVLPFIN